MSEANALEIPPTVAGDLNATEIARIWAAHGQQHVHLRSEIWDDAGHWGIMLVDLARHIANAYEQDGRGDYFQVLARIREIFEAEWDSPTDIARGKLTDRPEMTPTPNHAMERTADRRASTFQMTSTHSPRATRALVRRRSSCSR